MDKKHQVRIIGGNLKGKTLPVLDLEGLRPTPDRVRETIFNWIGSKIENAKVLDLFAGSGALGIEALSRGASKVTLIEKSTKNANNLKNITKNITQINQSIDVINIDALEFLHQNKEQFDIVFVDPPYKSNLLKSVLIELLQHIHEKSLIYVEMMSLNKENIVGYEKIKEDIAGQAKYSIWKKSSFL